MCTKKLESSYALILDRVGGSETLVTVCQSTRPLFPEDRGIFRSLVGSVSYHLQLVERLNVIFRLYICMALYLPYVVLTNSFNRSSLVSFFSNIEFCVMYIRQGLKTKWALAGFIWLRIQSKFLKT